MIITNVIYTLLYIPHQTGWYCIRACLHPPGVADFKALSKPVVEPTFWVPEKPGKQRNSIVITALTNNIFLFIGISPEGFSLLEWLKH